MKYVISIDWLQLWCSIPGGFHPIGKEIEENTIFSPLSYGYHKENHGTRQFRELWTISYKGAELANLQAVPCSGIFKSDVICVKFANRVLYQQDCWYLIDKFLLDHNCKVENITRCDLCADFTTFAGGREPIKLIHDFLSSKIRHVGRGIGAAYFHHGSKIVQGFSTSFVNYSGLSFGSHESDTRVYLYNKSLELRSVKDKPYIRDLWEQAGILEKKPAGGYKDVWRLEVSIKSKGMHFVNKNTKERVDITMDSLRVKEDVNWFAESGCYDLQTIYLSFVRQLFAFIRNHDAITNVTRELRIQLFDTNCTLVRACLREISCSSRAEKILLHSLWDIADKYRGPQLYANAANTRKIAHEIAQHTDLGEWLNEKIPTWGKQLYK